MSRSFAVVSFTEDEKEQLRKFTNRSYLLDKTARHHVWLSLVDILLSYSYEVRSTEGEHNVSVWACEERRNTSPWKTKPSSVSVRAFTDHHQFRPPVSSSRKLLTELISLLPAGGVAVDDPKTQWDTLLAGGETRFNTRAPGPVVTKHLLSHRRVPPVVCFLQTYPPHKESVNMSHDTTGFLDRN